MNVLVQGRRVTAVLDWANARSGDPRADLARTASILRFAPFPEKTPAPVACFLRRMLEAGWRHGYREMAGPIRGMAPFYAWAAAVMVNDLSPRLGRRDLPWLTPAFLDEVRAWGAGWRFRAGLMV
jgi:aminoglycoside phosphotransferase (APT) family kinase protein